MASRKLVQVCAVVRDLDKTLKLYWDLLGIGPWDVYSLTPETVREFTDNGRVVDEWFEFNVAVAMVGDVQFELVQPIAGPIIYTTFLEKRGEGLHHIKLHVKDDEMEETIGKFKAQGIEVIQGGKFDDDMFYYLNTDPVLGIICELGNNGKVRPPGRRYPPEAVNEVRM